MADTSMTQIIEKSDTKSRSVPPLPFKLELDNAYFQPYEVKMLEEHLHDSREFVAVLDNFKYPQLVLLLNSLIAGAMAFYRDRLGIETEEKFFRSKFENLLDYKARVGCQEHIESCLNEGCQFLNLRCAVRKIKEDIASVAKIFELRKNRSQIPHVAIELFFKRIIEDYNCIGIVLSDKSGAPKIFTTDGSGLSGVIAQGVRRLADAIETGEFKFSLAGEPYLVFNQRFPLTEELTRKVQATHHHPYMSKFIQKLTFCSCGFEFAHEKMVLSIIYIGDNMLTQFLKKTIRGIERIKVETDPEARLRQGFGQPVDEG